MAIEFNIAGTPPTAEDIIRERARLEARLVSITRWGWAAFIVLLLVAAGLWWVWWQGGMTNEGLLVIALIASAVVAVTVAVVTVEDPLEMAKSNRRDEIGRLDPAPREACLEIAAWAARDQAVDAYRAAVVGQGRQITRAEVGAMEEWVAGAGARRAEEEKRQRVEQACREVYEVRG